MTQEQLDTIKARHAAATPGEWYVSGSNVVETDDSFICGEGYQSWSADAEFIANAHQDIPALIEALGELSAENEALREAVGATSANWAIEAVSLRKEAAKNKLELLNLTTPRKPIAERTLVGDYRCPRCEAAFIVSLDEIPAGVTNFCGHCGQPLDWSQTSYAEEATPYSKISDNLEQENPYSNEAPKDGITRGDRIRQMIDEELAEWLQDLTGVLCPEHCLYAETNKCNDGACVEGTLAWLRQPEGE